ncbi:hypothetical protein M569_16710, partial [Genlisea aurea]
GEYCDLHGREKAQRRFIFAAVGGFILFLLILLFILIWLILRPTKPHFSLQSAAVYGLNFDSSASLLNTTLQIRVAFRNPNRRIGIYYERLRACAAYRGERITPPAVLPAAYLGHGDVAVWSPFLVGQNVPINPYDGVDFVRDQIAGTVMVNIEIDGRIRWKVGRFISGRHRLQVNCPAYVDSDKILNGGVSVRPVPVRYMLIMKCRV